MKPAILTRLISQLRAKGYKQNAAEAIATSALQKSGNLHPGTQRATYKGIHRGMMSPAERAKDRAARKSGRKTSDYIYHERTNRVTIKK
jgi:hypothetical protein